jgi:hypothetical protein
VPTRNARRPSSGFFMSVLPVRCRHDYFGVAPSASHISAKGRRPDHSLLE